MSYPWLMPLLAAIATLILAVLVNRKGPRTELSQSFTFLASMLVFWNLTFFALYSIADYDLAFDVTRVLRVGGLFLQPAILHVFVVLQQKRSRFWRAVLVFDYAFACVLTAANLFDLLVTHLQRFAWGYYSVGGPLYNVFTIYLITNFAAAFGVGAHNYRTSREPRIRLQLKLWMLGAVIALPLGLTQLLPVYGIPIYPLGNLGNAAWAGVMAYAVIRHRLMDIDLVITKGITYVAVSLTVIAPAFVLTLWLQRLSFGQIHPDFSFAVLIMLIGVGLLFPTLRLRTELRIEQSLFREKHAHRSALREFTRSILTILDTKTLFQELGSTVTTTLNLESVAIGISQDEGRTYLISHSTGRPCKTIEFSYKHPLILSLARRREAILRDELEASEDAMEQGIASGICRANGWEVCIPLSVTGKLIGFISLGQKKDLDVFSTGDLDLLNTLAAEAAIALENARLYEELKKSQDIIRRADRLSALGMLAAGIAHEVRNPLVAIQTFFQLAPERLHDEEFLTTFLNMTANEVKRISGLISELLSFARSPTRTLGPLDLKDVVDRVATLLDPEARSHKLRLVRDLDPRCPLIYADADQVKQVIINLVLNAIQATGPGGSVSISTRMVQHRGRTFGQLEVRDTGSGIPKERLDDVFNPFFTTKDKGTGLGLAIAHQIVTEHGGGIRVESEEGLGTSFFVELPSYAETNTTDASEAYSRLPRRAAS